MLLVMRFFVENLIVMRFFSENLISYYTEFFSMLPIWRLFSFEIAYYILSGIAVHKQP